MHVVSEVPTNLRRQEMLVRIAESLEQLELAADEIFGEINKKVDQFKQRLQEIDDRTAVAKSKVDLIRTWENKATRVFSNNKYPTKEIGNVVFDYQSLFTNCNLDKLTSRGEIAVKDRPKITAQLVPFDEELLKEKLQFYNIKKRTRKRENLSELPLGRVPWERITCLGSLLLFNTSEVAYSKRSQKMKRVDTRKNLQVTELEAPPTSIVEQAQEQQDLKFELVFDVAPQITEHLPLALPSLPGIAGGFVFNEENVAPLAIKKNLQLPDIGNFSVSTNTVDGAKLPTLDTRLEQVSSTTNDSFVPPPPPPPPPLPPSFPDTPPKEPALPAAPQLPQPPPPPAPVATPAPASGPAPTLPTVDNGRASLLESIRAAGGKVTHKEKKIKAKKQKQQQESLGSTKQSGGNLMDDLMKRLSLRRDGISGGKGKEEGNGTVTKMENQSDSIMERMAKNIPHIEHSKHENSGSEVDDWD